MIGPIIEEVVYEANKDYLLNEVKNKITKLPHEDLDRILDIIEQNEAKIEELLTAFQLNLINNLDSLKKEVQVKPILRQNQLVAFKDKITEYAIEWEENIEKARILGESGKIEEGQLAFNASFYSLNKLINAYRINNFLFEENVRANIDKMLNDAENSNSEEPLILLVEAIQRINLETELLLSQID